MTGYNLNNSKRINHHYKLIQSLFFSYKNTNVKYQQYAEKDQNNG